MRVLLAASVLAAIVIPAAAQNERIPTSDLQNEALVRTERAAFRPDYAALIGPRYAELEKLEQEVMMREQKMQDVSCSHQIVTELRWLTSSTAYIDQIDARLTDLRASLAHRFIGLLAHWKIVSISDPFTLLTKPHDSSRKDIQT